METNYTIEDRGTLVDAMSFIFNQDRRVISRKATPALIKMLQDARMDCRELMNDLIEDGRDLLDIPTDLGELIMVWYGAAVRWIEQNVPNKEEEKLVAAKKGKAAKKTAGSSFKTVDFFVEMLRSSPTRKEFLSQAEQHGIKAGYARTFLQRASKEDEGNNLKNKGLVITKGEDGRLYLSAIK